MINVIEKINENYNEKIDRLVSLEQSFDLFDLTD